MINNCFFRECLYPLVISIRQFDVPIIEADFLLKADYNVIHMNVFYLFVFCISGIILFIIQWNKKTLTISTINVSVKCNFLFSVHYSNQSPYNTFLGMENLSIVLYLSILIFAYIFVVNVHIKQLFLYLIIELFRASSN